MAVHWDDLYMKTTQHCHFREPEQSVRGNRRTDRGAGKRADQTQKTLGEACSRLTAKVQAVFIVSFSFLGLERWTWET